MARITSSLFKFMQSYKTETIQAISPLDWSLHETQDTHSPYYLVQMPTLPDNRGDGLFSDQGFLCQERHLRIDQFYESRTVAMPFAHYTEYHQHPHNRMRLVHVYFDARVEQWSIEVKEKSSIQAEYHPVKLTKETRSKIIECAKNPCDVLKKLLEAKTRQYLLLAREVAALDQTLTDLSRGLRSENFRSYQTEATRFIITVEKKNKLAEGPDIDPSAELMRKQLKRYKQIFQTVSVEPATEVTVSSAHVAQSSRKKAKSSQKRQKNKQTSEKRQAFESKKAVIVALTTKIDEIVKTAPSAQGYLLAHKNLEQLQDLLIELEFDVSLRAYQQDAFMKQAKEVIQAFTIAEKNFFLGAIASNDIESFKVLFTRMSATLQLEGMKQLFLDLLKLNSFDEGLKKLPFFEFLKKHSRDYRLAILDLSSFFEEPELSGLKIEEKLREHHPVLLGTLVNHGLRGYQTSVTEEIEKTNQTLIACLDSLSSPIAWFILGECYQQGYMVSKSDSKTFEYYQKSADGGLAEAQYNVGCYYDEGKGCQQDKSKAFEYYQKAAEQNLAWAQYNVGLCYEEGKGCSQSDESAFEYYQKAADQGLTVAQSKLGLFYAKGKGCLQNDKSAFEWFKKAADQDVRSTPYKLEYYYTDGIADAQYNVGYHYSKGKGCLQNDSLAFEYYQKAADRGLVVAQCSLGGCYSTGKGCPQNDQSAFEWFKKAADQGLTSAQHDETAKQAIGNAQYNVGVHYATGKGCQKDKNMAREYFQKAAALGVDGAQEALKALQPPPAIRFSLLGNNQTMHEHPSVQTQYKRNTP